MEANKEEHFVDGFMIKHFDIWPIGIDKNDLFDQQKVFLIYLMGIIPEFESWQMQVEYSTKKKDIANIKSVELDQADIDLARMHGEDISELKKTKLIEEKKKKMAELNERFGVETKEEKSVKPLPKQEQAHEQQMQLWEMLQGKGIVKK